jgi:hypothetical protein
MQLPVRGMTWLSSTVCCAPPPPPLYMHSTAKLGSIHWASTAALCLACPLGALPHRLVPFGCSRPGTSSHHHTTHTPTGTLQTPYLSHTPTIKCQSAGCCRSSGCRQTRRMLCIMAAGSCPCARLVRTRASAICKVADTRCPGLGALITHKLRTSYVQQWWSSLVDPTD